MGLRRTDRLRILRSIPLLSISNVTRPRFWLCPSLFLLLASARFADSIAGIASREVVEVRAERVPHGMRPECAGNRGNYYFYTQPQIAPT